MFRRVVSIIVIGAVAASLGGCNGGGKTKSSSSSSFSSLVGVAIAENDFIRIPANEESLLDMLTNDQGENVIFANIRNLEIGSIQLRNTEAIYTPPTDFTGSVSFQYQIENEYGLSNWATVNIEVVSNVDEVSPVAVADHAQGLSNTPLTIPLLDNDHDPQGESLSIVSVSTVSNGVIEQTSTGVIYTANADFVGEEQFQYTIENESGARSSASVTIVIDALPNLIAENDRATVLVNESVVVSVLSNDQGVDGVGGVTLELINPPASGVFTLTEEGTGILYQPLSDFIGEQSIDYRISNGQGAQSNATLTVVVNADFPDVVHVDVLDVAETIIRGFPSADDAELVSVLSLKARRDPSLLLTVKNGGVIEGQESDFIYRLTPHDGISGDVGDNRPNEISLAEIESGEGSGMFLYDSGQNIYSDQFPVLFDGNQDNKNDLIFLRYFGLSYYPSQSANSLMVNSRVDLDSEGIYFSALNTNLPDIMSAAGGDFNRDGIEDLAVSVGPLGESNAPKVKVFFGPISTEEKLFDRMLDGQNGFEISGFDLGSDVTNPIQLLLSDLNGDGNLDLIISGISEKNPYEQVTGQAYVIWGGADAYSSFSIDTLTEERFSQSQSTTPSGSVLYWGAEDAPKTMGAILRSTDFNGDGIMDLVISNSVYQSVLADSVFSGVSLVYGQDQWPVTVDISDSQANTNVAHFIYNKDNVSGPTTEVISSIEVGDLNGDQHGDVLLKGTFEVAAILGNAIQPPYIVDAGNVTSQWPTVIFELDFVEKQFSVMDMDSDGFEDVVLFRENSNDEVEGFIVYGKNDF